MSKTIEPIKPPADAVEIYHEEHGVAHCDKLQLKDMQSEGWTTKPPKPKAEKPPA